MTSTTLQLNENLGSLDVVARLTPEVLKQIADIVADVPIAPTTAHVTAISFRGAGEILGAPSGY